ncbi:hypothetical protein CF386_07445 [Paraphotobacterium marinum]|uniref:Stress adaptor protein CpxP n=1 Tax=Paraphotobacterium marinum TaxID=1755811 RepID=A0A220VES1_9GAMM|nr:Spy/CpxP family protein refolding chaperone [Paraphotobacterium marinum]ASK78894.1 hypothetical protein CF386_07445 [Paraphotobacterium marinum]
MNSTKKISAAIMVVSLIVGSTSAFAYGHHKNGCGHHHKGLYKQLNLTDKQKEEFKNIREQSKEAMKASRAEYKKTLSENKNSYKEAMQKYVMNDSGYDKDKIQQLISEKMNAKAKLKTEQKMIRLEAKHNMYKDLTAEQQTKLKQIKAKQFEQCAVKLEKKSAKLSQKSEKMKELAKSMQ